VTYLNEDGIDVTRQVQGVIERVEAERDALRTTIEAKDAAIATLKLAIAEARTRNEELEVNYQAVSDQLTGLLLALDARAVAPIRPRLEL
jgi:cell division septum initiation protein DivIVA